MSIEVNETRKTQLDEIVGLINREEEMKLLYGEDTKMWEHAESVLKGLNAYVEKLEPHERTYVEMGLITHPQDKDETYDPKRRTKHQKEKYARLDQEGKTRSDEEWRRV